MRPKLNLLIIKPSWLRVDKATIFFISDSPKAVKPAIHIVIAPNSKNILKLIVCMAQE